MLSFEKLNDSHHVFLYYVSIEYEPLFLHQTVKLESWRNVIDAEIAAMKSTNTWSIIPLSHGQHVVGCKWVYQVKYNEDGIVDKYKAQLIAKGYSQQEDVDFVDTFSSAAKIVTLKVLLSLTTFAWSLYQINVNNAYLNDDLFEELHVTSKRVITPRINNLPSFLLNTNCISQHMV